MWTRCLKRKIFFITNILISARMRIKNQAILYQWNQSRLVIHRKQNMTNSTKNIHRRCATFPEPVTVYEKVKFWMTIVYTFVILCVNTSVAKGYKTFTVFGFIWFVSVLFQSNERKNMSFEFKIKKRFFLSCMTNPDFITKFNRSFFKGTLKSVCNWNQYSELKPEKTQTQYRISTTQKMF